MAYEPPDLSNMKTEELVPLMLACGMSSDPSDKAFAKACRDEIARRKPNTGPPKMAMGEEPKA